MQGNTRRGSAVFDITVIVEFEAAEDGTSVSTRIQGVNPPQHVDGFDEIDGRDVDEDDRWILDWVVVMIETGGSLSLARFVQQHLEDERNRRMAER